MSIASRSSDSHPRPVRPANSRRRLLGEMLVAQSIISQQQLDDVLARQKSEKGSRIGRLLVELGHVTETQLAALIADQLRIPLVRLSGLHIPPEVIRLLPKELAIKHGCVPVQREGRQLTIALADPSNVHAVDAIGFALGLAIKPVVAAESDVAAAMSRYYGSAPADYDAALLRLDRVDLASQLSVVDDAEPPEIETPEDVTRAAHTAPVIQLVNGILADAIQAGASDIHIEPQEQGVSLRYRVDGLLRQVLKMPKRAHPKIVSRIKIMSHMDIAERRRPQDGRSRVAVTGRTFDLRVSTLPTADGEKLVIRILVQDRAQLSLEDLGFEPDTLSLYTGLIRRPQGLVLITGPTGSGKTSTLYASLNMLRSETSNIVTIEDPVEYRLAGINQVAVNDKAGMTFAAGLRSILRQDPDIVMVGEIRDAETAEVAFQAAQTGHLVLSTLHTNDAPSAITRLIDMGVPAYMVASAVIGVQAQRLVRRLCSCTTVAEDGEARSVGCDNCRNTGYRGRVAVYETMAVASRLRRVISGKGSDDDLRDAARALGMRTLFEDGLRKVARGLTTREEVLRVAPPPEPTDVVRPSQDTRRTA